MWALLVYCVVFATLAGLTVMFYLFERNKKPSLALSEAEQMQPISNSTPSISVLHTVETQRYDESMSSSEKPKRSSYKKANLKIEIPETPRGINDGPEIQCSQLIVTPTQSECLPVGLFLPSKIARFKRMSVFLGQFCGDCFVLSLVVGLGIQTRANSKYFAMGMIACAGASYVSALATIGWMLGERWRQGRWVLAIMGGMLAAMVATTLFLLIGLTSTETFLWVTNFLTMLGTELLILEPLRGFLKVGISLYSKENQCCPLLWPQ